MKRIRKKIALFLALIMLFSIVPISTSESISYAEELSVSIAGGNISMVPGDFSVLRIDAEEEINITDTTWSVDKNNIVNLDSKTGRIDAIGSGKATITLIAIDEDNNQYEAKSEVVVSGGSTPIVEPISELQNNNRPDFMMGADISSLYQIMEENKKYYDLDGKEAHLFDVLAE